MSLDADAMGTSAENRDHAFFDRPLPRSQAGGVKGLIQIGLEHIPILDADGQTHQIVDDAQLLPILRRDGGVGHGHRVGDQRFHTPRLVPRVMSFKLR